jgi:hypothetical protein
MTRARAFEPFLEPRDGNGAVPAGDQLNVLLPAGAELPRPHPRYRSRGKNFPRPRPR